MQGVRLNNSGFWYGYTIRYLTKGYSNTTLIMLPKHITQSNQYSSHLSEASPRPLSPQRSATGV